MSSQRRAEGEALWSERVRDSFVLLREIFCNM